MYNVETASAVSRQSDAELIDAYSSTVINAVDRAGPAVVQVAIAKNGKPAGIGSGLILASDGIVMTNSHVVHGASEITLTSADGQRGTARILGDDPHTDIAVVRTDANLKAPALDFFDSRQV